MFTSLPDPTVADPGLAAARRGSLEALGREASRPQRQVAQAPDSGPAEGIIIHDVCPNEIRAYVDRGVEWAEYFEH
eukprot:5887114-Lingulodinium_polyedra.AAC.1